MMTPNRATRYAIPGVHPLQSYDKLAERNSVQTCVPAMNSVYLVAIPPNDDTYHSPTLWTRKMSSMVES